MANTKKFVAKNGILIPQSAIIGGGQDNEVDILQVSGSSDFSGAVSIYESSIGPTLTVENTSNANNAIVSEFKGDSDSLQILNTSQSSYAIYNSRQKNGIVFSDGASGLDIQYNETSRLTFNSTENAFSGLTTIDGSRILTTADEGSGNGLDADTIDGLDSTQFVRSDQNDTLDGSYNVTGNFLIAGNLTVSGNTTTVDTETVLIADNIITLNSNYTGSNPTESSGFEIERGTQPNSSLLWDELNDYWKLISAGADLGRIITTADEGSGNGFDADTLDGLDSTQFLRSDVDDTAEGNITIEGDLTLGDNSSEVFVYFRGQNQDRILYQNNGQIGFLNSALNYAAYSNSDSDWIVARDVLANRNVESDGFIKSGSTIEATTSITAGTDVIGQRFVDSESSSYFLDPANSSTLNNISLEGRIAHNNDTNTYVHFSAADTFNVVAGGTNALIVTSTNVTSSVDVLAPKFVDSDDDSYYLDPANSTLSLFANGELTTNYAVSVKAIDGAGNVTPSTDEIRLSGYGLIGNRGTVYITNAGGDVQIGTGSSHNSDSGLIVSSTRTTSLNDVYAPRYYDSNDDNFYGDFAGTSILNGLQVDQVISAPGIAGYSDSLVAEENRQISPSELPARRLKFGFTSYSNNNSAPYADFLHMRSYGDQTGGSDNLVMFKKSGIGMRIWQQNYGSTTPYSTFGDVPFYNVNPGAGVFNFYASTFYDSEESEYYVDPAGTSRLVRLDIDNYLRHNSDTNNYLGFPSNDNQTFVTNGSERLGINNSLVSAKVQLESTVSVSAPIFYDRDDVNYFANYSGNGTNISLALGGAVRVGNISNNTRWSDTSGDGGISILPKGAESPAQGSLISISGGDDGGLLHLNRIGMSFNPYDTKNTYIQLYSTGQQKSSLSGDAFDNLYWILSGNYNLYDDGANALFIVQKDGNVIIGDTAPAYTQSDNIPVQGSISQNKLHVSGSIQLNGNNDAIVFGRGDSSFLKDGELGFGWGGGLYMNDNSLLRIRNNKSVFTSGDYYGSRFYAEGASDYYLDPNGDSQLNEVHIDDYIRHRGDTDTAIGFNTNDSFIVNTGDNRRLTITNSSATFNNDVYAPRYYDSDDDNFYGDFAGTSILKYLNVFSGDSSGEMSVGRNINERIRLYAFDGPGGLEYYQDETDGTDHSFRFEIRSGSSGANRFSFNRPVDFLGNSLNGIGNIYAKRYYDLDDPDYYGDFAETSIINSIELKGVIRGDSDTYLQFHADNQFRVVTGGSERLVVSDSYVLANREIRAPIFRDSDNPTNYYGDFGGTSVMNVVRSNQYQVDGSTYTIDSPSGNYGSIQVDGAKGGYAGYAIRDDWVFMSPDVATSGIYNDTDNEWSAIFRRNAEVELFYNGVIQAETQNGYFLANNEMRAPKFADSVSSSYYLDPNAGNTNQALRINGRIWRDGWATGSGNNNVLIETQDYSHWIWNTASDWGIFWAGNDGSYRSHFSSSNPNELVFIGNGSIAASFDLDNGDAFFNRNVYGSTFNIKTGGEDLPINPAYGTGGADLVLFDSTEYFEKRVVRPLRGSENTFTDSTSEYVLNSDGPFAGKHVLRTSAYRDFDSDYIPVEPGETIYGQISVRTISGSGGLLYVGVRRYDKDKRPIAGNDGITYFVIGGSDRTSTSWETLSGHTTIPTSHTPHNDSDGGGCRYVRLIVLMNYNAGGALREFGGIMLKRANVRSNLQTKDLSVSGSITATGNISADDATFDVINANVLRDRDTSSYYIDPGNSGTSANLRGSIKINGDDNENWLDMDSASNGYARIRMGGWAGDPFIEFSDRSNGTGQDQVWAFGADDRETGSMVIRFNGNLGFPSDWTSAGQEFFQLKANGNLSLSGGEPNNYRLQIGGSGFASTSFIAPIFRDSADPNNYFADPASTSIFGSLVLRTGGLKMERAYGDNSIWFNGGVDENHVLWNDYHGGPRGRGVANSGFDGMLWNTFRGIQIRGGSQGQYNLIRATNSGGVTNDHYVQLYSQNVEQLGTRPGYGFAPNAMHSPIFRDSADPNNYYGDFASTSRMNTLTVNRINMADRGDFITFYGDDSTFHSITSRDSGGGISDDLRFNSYHDIFFNLDSNNNNSTGTTGFYIGQHGGPSSTIGTQWAFRAMADGNAYASTGVYAPIFRDLNDPLNYYADPAGMSRFAGLTLDSGNLDTVLKFGPARASNDDAHIEWKGDVNAGYLRISTSDDDGTEYIQFGDYDNTNRGGTFTEWVRMNRSGLYHTREISAPIFRDLNNPSSYYGDFAGSSRMNYVHMNELLVNGGGHSHIVVDGNGDSGFYQSVHIGESGKGSAALHLTYRGDGYSWIGMGDGNQRVPANWAMRMYYTTPDVLFNNNVDVEGAVTSQIFYDRNNTGYYADPAGTSNMYLVRARNRLEWFEWIRYMGGSNGGLYWETGTGLGYHIYPANRSDMRLRTGSGNGGIVGTIGNETPRGYIHWTTSNEIGFLNASRNWSLRVDNSNNAFAGGSFRAPIFYDTNNTGYYTDPASTSSLNSLSLAGYSRANNGFQIFRNLGTRTGSWQDGEHTMSLENSDAGYLTINFHRGGYTSNNLLYTGSYFRFDSSVRSTSEMRSPIYYDENDTTYRVDPNGTSQLNDVRGNIFGDRASTSYYLNAESSQWRVNTPSGYVRIGPANGSYTHYETDRANHYMNKTLHVNGDIRVYNRRARLSGDVMYADTYYDANSGGYYTDPASTSRLNSVTANVYNSPYAGGNSGLTRSSYPYSFGFQEGGAWSYPYPDLVLQFHTGMKFAANASYEGMRFYADHNDNTLIFQINGGSNYTYKYTWMNTNTTGFYSGTNGWHIEPNTQTSYGSMNIRGSRNGYYGIGFNQADNDPHLMFNNSGNGNGGLYWQGGGRWALFYSHSNNCLGIASSSTSSAYELYVSGDIYATGNIVAYSDRRRKKNIKTIDNALEKVLQLRGVSYNKIPTPNDKLKENHERTEIGVIAQEVEEILPEVVTYAKDVDEYSVSYGNMVALLIESTKEQQDIINKQQEEIDELKAMVSKLMEKL